MENDKEIRSELERLAKCCKWTFDEAHGKWDADCGDAFSLSEGTPRENNMRFCPFCGSELQAFVPMRDFLEELEERVAKA